MGRYRNAMKKLKVVFPGSWYEGSTIAPPDMANLQMIEFDIRDLEGTFPPEASILSLDDRSKGDQSAHQKMT